MIFEFLGNGEKDIFHTIKWLEEIYTNVERDWLKFLKKSHNGIPPDKKSKIWKWLQKIKDPKKYKRELDEALIMKLAEITNSEAEIIKAWCTSVKLLFVRIRSTFKQLEMDHLESLIYDGGNPEIKF